MSAKEIREYFKSDEFLKAREIAGNAIEKMNVMFDKAEKYDQLEHLLEDLVDELRKDTSLGSHELFLFEQIESIITSDSRIKESPE